MDATIALLVSQAVLWSARKQGRVTVGSTCMEQLLRDCFRPLPPPRTISPGRNCSSVRQPVQPDHAPGPIVSEARSAGRVRIALLVDDLGVALKIRKHTYLSSTFIAVAGAPSPMLGNLGKPNSVVCGHPQLIISAHMCCATFVPRWSETRGGKGSWRAASVRISSTVTCINAGQ